MFVNRGIGIAHFHRLYSDVCKQGNEDSSLLQTVPWYLQGMGIAHCYRLYPDTCKQGNGDSSLLQSAIDTAVYTYCFCCTFVIGKVAGFEFRQENFLLQGQFSYFWHQFHPCVTAVACKRSQSFCQQCRWQVTAKCTCALRMWPQMK